MLLIDLSDKLDSLKSGFPDWLNFVETATVENAKDFHREGQNFFLDDRCHRIECVN